MWRPRRRGCRGRWTNKSSSQDGAWEGDRYAAGIGTFSERAGKRDVTLIESETLEATTRESGQNFRRPRRGGMFLTQGVRLNDLVGRELGMFARPAAERALHSSHAIDWSWTSRPCSWRDDWWQRCFAMASSLWEVGGGGGKSDE